MAAGSNPQQGGGSEANNSSAAAVDVAPVTVTTSEVVVEQQQPQPPPQPNQSAPPPPQDQEPGEPTEILIYSSSRHHPHHHPGHHHHHHHQDEDHEMSVENNNGHIMADQEEEVVAAVAAAASRRIPGGPRGLYPHPHHTHHHPHHHHELHVASFEPPPNIEAAAAVDYAANVDGLDRFQGHHRPPEDYLARQYSPGRTSAAGNAVGGDWQHQWAAANAANLAWPPEHHQNRFIGQPSASAVANIPKWIDGGRPASNSGDHIIIGSSGASGGGSSNGSNGGGGGGRRSTKLLCSPNNGANTVPSELIPDEQLAQLTVKELNKRVQNLARDEVVALKQRRRTLKNRG